MLYILEIEVTKSYYMGDTTKKFVSHIVEAESEQEAMDKLAKHYTDQDSEYSYTYWVSVNYCHELIK
jgi:hypothetical protein